jgi:hypothetical protein
MVIVSVLDMLSVSMGGKSLDEINLRNDISMNAIKSLFQ